MRIPFEIFSVIAGIWAGFAFTFTSRSIIRLNKAWSHEQQQSFVNRISLQNILLVCGLFAVGRVFGSGVVFGIWMWFDSNINSSRMIGYIVCLNIAVGGVFFGYNFSRLFSTPFIFTVVVARLLSSIFLYQFQGFKYWSVLGKGLAIVGIFLLPLTAYGSSLSIICPN